MTRAQAFSAAVGGVLAHVTAASNAQSIAAGGLKSAADLARDAGVPSEHLLLRRKRLGVGQARLNHQRPIAQALRAAERMLEGHSPQSWAAQLDRRIFFWPRDAGKRFAASISRDTEITILWLDAQGLAERYADYIDLSPLNSGNFTQGGAHAQRGDWLYRPLSEGLAAFRTHRRARGLVQGRDTIREVSLRCPLPAHDLTALRVTP
ncbi:MAG: hypothetical protein AAF744_00315 [Pseudomonadota bacterium]